MPEIVVHGFRTEKILSEFIKSGIQPLPDRNFGEGFRCSAYLTDKTFLPCVIIRKCSPIVDMALRRFEEEKKRAGMFKKKDAYRNIVGNFVVGGNTVNSYDIARVENSRYAIPIELLGQIKGETTMSWTGFVLEMRDGVLLSYGTTFLAEFFDIPAKYSFDDVVRIHNHSYVSKKGHLIALEEGYTENPEDYDRDAVYREKPYFVCYIDE